MAAKKRAQGRPSARPLPLYIKKEHLSPARVLCSGPVLHVARPTCSLYDLVTPQSSRCFDSSPLQQDAQLCLAAIADFGRDPPTTVFLLTTRSGAVGINLTAANHVFLLEPALNPALEEQAIGRAWRMGQTRPVIVKRLFVKVKQSGAGITRWWLFGLCPVHCDGMVNNGCGTAGSSMPLPVHSLPLVISRPLTWQNVDNCLLTAAVSIADGSVL